MFVSDVQFNFGIIIVWDPAPYHASIYEVSFIAVQYTGCLEKLVDGHV